MADASWVKILSWRMDQIYWRWLLGRLIEIVKTEFVMQDLETMIKGWLREDPFYEKVFRNIGEKRLEACLQSRSSGYMAGIPFAQKATKLIGIEAVWKKRSGEPVREGEKIAQFWGTPEQVARLENIVIGLISKPSGIATAAHEAKTLADGKIRLVSGGWKKHPLAIKGMILEAVTSGGIAHRLVDEPFVYLDKNYVRIFGGISKALQDVASLSGIKVIQLRGEFANIADEAREALSLGAQVLMVDTGSWQDLDDVLTAIHEENISPRVRLAFGGGIKMKDIPALAQKGVDILDIGSAILDAPWLDLSYDVVKGP
jgi:nicotinate-nucleotide pyrophosphorylase (carboxylating)